MSSHLSQEQFARCFAGTPTLEESRHIAACGECREDLEAFGATVSRLRYAIRERVDAHPAAPLEPYQALRAPKLRWALAAAAILLLGMMPLLTPRPAGSMQQPQMADSPEALMDAINVHLSRTVPSPMEPMMSLLPGDQIEFVVGGIQ